MRARVLITNGARTIDVFWLEHKGSDVYWGTPGFADKRSYHSSGQIHTKRRGRAEDLTHHTPLASLRGQFNLTSMNLGNAGRFVQAAARRFEYSRRRSDVVLTVDTRTVPAAAQTCIMVGLLEPRNSRALMSPLSLTMPLPNEQLLPQQLIVSTAVEPWVYASVYWWMRGAS